MAKEELKKEDHKKEAKPKMEAKKEEKKEAKPEPKKEAKKEGPKKAKAEVKKEEEQKHLLELSRISLWLDDYGDIFSDFDPRPYSQRTLSDDFLAEAKKASVGKATGELELQLSVAADKRNAKDESIIKKRLRRHFHKSFQEMKRKKSALIKQGAAFAFAGIVLMFIATFFLYKYEEASFAISFLVVLFEPGGWFLFWEGMYLSIFEVRDLKPDLNFYKKMSKCKVEFLSY